MTYGHGASAGGLLHQIGLGECGEHDDGGDVFIADNAGSGDAVHTRHLDIHAHHIRQVLAGQFHGFLAVGGLSNDLITVVFQHGDQIHAVHGFVLGHDNGTRTVLGLGLALSRFAFIGHGLELFVGQHLIDVDTRFFGLLPCSHANLFLELPNNGVHNNFSELLTKVPSVGLEPTTFAYPAELRAIPCQESLLTQFTLLYILFAVSLRVLPAR